MYLVLGTEYYGQARWPCNGNCCAVAKSHNQNGKSITAYRVFVCEHSRLPLPSFACKHAGRWLHRVQRRCGFGNTLVTTETLAENARRAAKLPREKPIEAGFTQLEIGPRRKAGKRPGPGGVFRLLFI